MIRGTIWLRFVAVGLLVLSASSDEVKDPSTRIAGKVEVKARQEMEPTKATLQSNDGVTYQIEMDEKGISFAKVMHREKAEISAQLFERDGKKWLRVLGYTDDHLTAAHELWRRMRCNACVVFPAAVNSSSPSNLHGTTPVSGRYFSFQEKFLAWTIDATYLWAATDVEIRQINLASGKVQHTYTRKDGLPDNWVYQLASDGERVWIVYRGGVAVLSTATGIIQDLPLLHSRFARVGTEGGDAWIVADSGTFRFRRGRDSAEAMEAIPTSERIRKVVDNGVWIPHWSRRTVHLIGFPVVLKDRLYVCSYGDLYELAEGKWKRLAVQGWNPTLGEGRLWFLSQRGVGEYNADKTEPVFHSPPDVGAGRYTHLLVGTGQVWVAVEPVVGEGGGKPGTGGLARLDAETGKWTTWRTINGEDAGHVGCLGCDDKAVWAVTMKGRYKNKPAHPGMTYVKNNVFETEGFLVNRLNAGTDTWASFPLEITEVDRRLICGQDGTRAMDTIVPRMLERISVTGKRMFGVARLVPKGYFGGYWPTVIQMGICRDGEGKWEMQFEHHPAELHLDGEQPLVLNISNGELIRNPEEVGERVLEAIGHDGVLGLFAHDGIHWAVTEGCVARFDEGSGRWIRVTETAFRYYWRATAAVEDGRWLYIGSDRGLIARMDMETGQTELSAALKNRRVVSMSRGAAGRIHVFGGQEPLGRITDRIAMPDSVLDAESIQHDDSGWKILTAGNSDRDLKPAWFFRQMEKRNNFDKSQGNFLFHSAEGSAPRAVYYVKDVFYPQFLCTSPDGKRIWLSIYTGLLRLDMTPQG